MRTGVRKISSGSRDIGSIGTKSNLRPHDLQKVRAWQRRKLTSSRSSKELMKLPETPQETVSNTRPGLSRHAYNVINKPLFSIGNSSSKEKRKLPRSHNELRKSMKCLSERKLKKIGNGINRGTSGVRRRSDGDHSTRLKRRRRRKGCLRLSPLSWLWLLLRMIRQKSLVGKNQFHRPKTTKSLKICPNLTQFTARKSN